MKVLKTIAAAFSMFSAIPVPAFPWEKDTLRFVLCAFPLVGAVIGLACWGWTVLCGFLAVPAILRAAGLCAIPALLTGGIHLDGFCDTWDALSSHADPAKKQEILKDPHVGAFAVIHLCLYFMGTFALWSALPVYQPVVILLSFCLSRSLSGLAVAAFPLAKGTGLAHTFARLAGRCRRPAGVCPLPDHGPAPVRRPVRRSGWLVPPNRRALDAGRPGTGRAAGRCSHMIFITGPLFAGKRDYVRTALGWTEAELSANAVWDVQDLAAGTEDLVALTDELARSPVVIATEVGGGVVPIDPEERARREAAGRLACLLAERADAVIRVFCGIPRALKGELL